MIKEKIKNGEGFLKIRRNGNYIEIPKIEKLENDILINISINNDFEKIKVYRGGESYIIPANEFDSSKEEIEWQPIANDYKIINNKLVLKTIEDKIIDIRDKAREQLLILKNNIEFENKRKIQLLEISDWTDGDEAKLNDMQKDYENAVNDYNSIKAQLLITIDNKIAFEAKLVELIPIFKKYNIKI